MYPLNAHRYIKIYQTRMDDQRSSAPPPGAPSTGTSNSQPVPNAGGSTAEPMMAAPDDESFFDMLAIMQQPRLGEQRSVLPQNGTVESTQSANTSVLEDELDADNMSFFEMMAVANKSAA